MKLSDFNNIYFIGIGGISMSGLAEILHFRGYNTAGSDSTASAVTKRLEDIGINVNIGQKAENLKGNEELIVYTAAVQQEKAMPK